MPEERRECRVLRERVPIREAAVPIKVLSVESLFHIHLSHRPPLTPGLIKAIGERQAQFISKMDHGLDTRISWRVGELLLTSTEVDFETFAFRYFEQPSSNS